ncbi:MAG: type 11 methyltransferase [Parcubacteria group bacterium]|nr:type 11 methyltransferase [Parcubacteria group bacterium]
MFTSPKQNILEFGFLPGQKVADLGSGAGHYTHALSAALGKDGRVISVDLDPALLVKVYKEGRLEGRDNIRPIDGNVEEMRGTKIADEALDGAVFGNILFFLKDKGTAIQEARRIVKKGGKIGVVEWSDSSYLARIKTEGVNEVIGEDKVKDLFKSEGFEFERSFPAGEHHYGLIFKK